MDGMGSNPLTGQFGITKNEVILSVYIIHANFDAQNFFFYLCR